jgi:general secretion pathway protein D
MKTRPHASRLCLVAAAAALLLASAAFAQEGDQPATDAAKADVKKAKVADKQKQEKQRVAQKEVAKPAASGGAAAAPVKPVVATPAPAAAPPAATPPAAPGAAAPSPDAGDDSDLYRCKKLPRNAKIKVTLKPETDLKELIQWAMSFTCKNFIFGQGIMGRSSKVTIIAPSDMTPNDAWNLFLVSLQTMNLNIVPKGNSLEIIESPSAKERPIPVYKGGGAPNSDQIVRVVLRPSNMTVDAATQVMNSLKSRDGNVTPIPDAGVIIVTDYGNVIDKMVEVMRVVDVPSEGEKVFIIKVHNADATQLAQKLNDIFGQKQGQGGGGGGAPQGRGPVQGKPAPGAKSTDATVSASAAPSKIVVDERTNSLVVVASDAAYARVLALVRRLDQPGVGGEGAIHVYYLENADAEEMSNTLGALLSGQSRPSSGGAGGRGAPQAAAPQAAGQTQGTNQVFEGQVRVTFDKPTNSLVIVSSDRDFISLRDVIRRLDVPRRQVFVEATILEVSLDKSRRLGLAFHGGLPYTIDGEQSLILGGVQHTDLGTISLNPQSFLGLSGGIRGSEIPGSKDIIGISVPSFGVLFQLLQNNNDVNVLSSPHILTTDNVPAEISVGQNIPFQAGFAGVPGIGGAGGTTGTTGTGTGFGFGTSVQRQDVALKLKITPHVNDSDMVRLEIEQEISDVASENFGGLGLGPSWTKRTIKTTVVVKDQQPVVIGGLMQDKTLINESKVPLFGDIPILGYLFKYQRKTKIKTNLLIFLTPYVIKDQSDLQRIFERKMRERREFLRAYSSFSDDKSYEPEMDYRRKTGLIEDINRNVRQTDEDEQMLREADTARGKGHDDDSGPVELQPGTGDDSGDDGPDVGTGGRQPPAPPPPQPQPDSGDKEY